MKEDWKRGFIYQKLVSLNEEIDQAAYTNNNKVPKEYKGVWTFIPPEGCRK